MTALSYMVDPPDFADWAGLHSLLDESFRYMQGRIDPPSSLTRMTPESLREKASEETLVLVHDAARLIACGFLREIDRAIYIGKVAVAAAYRGQGIAAEIMAIAERLARGSGKDTLELETRIELIENQKAFAAMGFAIVRENRHPGYDSSTSVTMRRPVAPVSAVV